MTLTYHAAHERAERIAALEEVLGFTSIVVEVGVAAEQVRYCITSSGVILIKNLQKDILITAYMASIAQVYAICRLAGKAQIPPKLYKRVIKNNERHRNLFYI